MTGLRFAKPVADQGVNNKFQDCYSIAGTAGQQSQGARVQESDSSEEEEDEYEDGMAGEEDDEDEFEVGYGGAD